MGIIYNSSLVTISAISSTSAQDGLFNAESSSILSQISGYSIPVASELSCGTMSTLYLGPLELASASKSIWRTLRDDAPLLLRAWVAQERMSSRRIIHYGATQMFWECEHCISSEDNALGRSDTFSMDDARMLFLSLYNRMPVGGFYLPENELLDTWYRRFIEGIYSRCKLTFTRDKLVAISGLAKLICKRAKLPYYAGHWKCHESCFIDSLQWVRDSLGAKTRQFRAPSWSWASQDSAIIFLVQTGARNTNHKYLSRILHLSAEHQPPATDSFGLISSCKLTIEGPLMVCELKYFSDACSEEMGVLLDDDTALLDDMVAHVLALSSVDGDVPDTHFLILGSTEGDSATMKRIGLGLARTSLEWAQELLRAQMTTVTII